MIIYSQKVTFCRFTQFYHSDVILFPIKTRVPVLEGGGAEITTFEMGGEGPPFGGGKHHFWCKTATFGRKTALFGGQNSYFWT